MHILLVNSGRNALLKSADALRKNNVETPSVKALSFPGYDLWVVGNDHE